MKEIEKVLMVVAEGLKAMALGINSIAERVNEIVKEPAPPVKKAPAAAKAAKPATRKKRATKTSRPAASGKAAAKPARKKKAKGGTKVTAIETVFRMFADSEDGIDTAAIIKATGFNAKKVANLLYKLTNQERIVRVGRGRYKAA
jgi:hypothetical protein